MESNGMHHVMNVGKEVQTVFYAAQPCLGSLDVSHYVGAALTTDLVIWTSSQMTFGQDKWTGRTEGSRDRETAE